MLRTIAVVAVLGLAACAPETRGPSGAGIALPPSGSGQVSSLRAMWKIKDIRQACVGYVESGVLPSTLGPLGFKAQRRSGGVVFSVASKSRGADKIQVMLKPHADGYLCETTHRTFGGFGSSAIAFAFHTELNNAGWEQKRPAPVGNSSQVGNGFWLKGTTGLLKRIEQKRSGKDSTGDQGYIMRVTLMTTLGEPK